MLTALILWLVRRQALWRVLAVVERWWSWGFVSRRLLEQLEEAYAELTDTRALVDVQGTVIVDLVERLERLEKRGAS